MTNLIVCGCCGKMGRVIAALAAQSETVRIAAGVDLHVQQYDTFPVYSALGDVREQADCIVDFSHPSALEGILAYARGKGLPVVLCTTGYTDEQVAMVKQAAQTQAVFYSRNMSIGINLLVELSKKAAEILGSDFDVEIIEMHHNQKIDAPSGTALMLADAVSSCIPGDTSYMYDRHSQRKKRSKNEIGIHSVRGGTIVGEHEVIFAGNHETVKLCHSAQSKEVFASGALNAARFMQGKPAGLYDMSDVVKAAL